MNDGHRISGPHIIKLNNKNVTVQLEYHSPPKKEPRTRVREVTLYQLLEKNRDEHKSIKKIRNLNSFKSIKMIKLTKQSPFYYHAKIEQSHAILAEYEKFHQRMVQNEAEPRKLKVYSNSKQLKTAKEKQTSKILANKDTNTPSKQIPNTHHKVPLRKIKLYSPNKAQHSQQKQNHQKESKLIILQNSNFSHHIALKGTPDRKYKLQVTSSKSKSKYDSIISNKNQISLQMRKQMRYKREEETPERFLNSINSLCLNDQ